MTKRTSPMGRRRLKALVASKIPSAGEIKKQQKLAETKLRFNFARTDLENKIRYTATFKGLGKPAWAYFDAIREVKLGAKLNPQARKAYAEASRKLKAAGAKTALDTLINGWLEARPVKAAGGKLTFVRAKTRK